MSSIIYHRCKDMITDSRNHQNDVIYERKNNIWRLIKLGEITQEHCRYCSWCDRSLQNFETCIDSSSPHRCEDMIEIENRRNSDKAHHKGDRSYVIEWLMESGWTLLNKNTPTNRTKLYQCPFCKASFPFMNQVRID